MNRSELFIPAYDLPVGLYQMTLSVRMLAIIQRNFTVTSYVRITRSKILTNLVYLGTSMISQSDQFDLVLNPGKYSVDPDAAQFNASVSCGFSLYLLVHCRVFVLGLEL
jgi:hypothetical protein